MKPRQARRTTWHSHSNPSHHHRPTPHTQAKDPACVKAILVAAQERARLQSPPPGHPNADPPQSEFVQGLTLEEAATLLNVDSGDREMMQMLYDAALNVKEQIYGTFGLGRIAKGGREEVVVGGSTVSFFGLSLRRRSMRRFNPSHPSTPLHHALLKI